EGVGTITTRTGGEFPVRHGDTVFVTPDLTRLHKFNDKGLAL
ncbi:MAG: sugar ABC transporter ATP-binding protein, partial [Allorhizobium sp.]